LDNSLKFKTLNFKNLIILIALFQISAAFSQIDTSKTAGKLIVTEKIEKENSPEKKGKLKPEKTDSGQQKPKRYYNPGTATWLAVACPGAGQIYNRRYWKLPIVYAGLGAALYFLIDNQREMIIARDSYRYLYYEQDPANTAPNPYKFDSKYNGFGGSQIVSYREYYRRNRDIAVVATVAVYALSIVDAVVDAHLRGFDISDNLTLKVKPDIRFNNSPGIYQTGIALSLSIK
jgi:hypothetical protein